LQQALLVRLTQDVVPAPVAGAEFCADEGAAAELQLAQVILDGLEVVVVELADERCEQAGEAVGAKRSRVLVGDLPHPLEHIGEQLEHLHGLVQHRVGGVAKPEQLGLPLALERLDRQLVQLPDDRGLFEAIAEDALAIENRFRVGKAREKAVGGELAQVLVAARHRIKERVELEVLAESPGVRRQRLLEVEVAVGVHEVDLHRAIRLRSAS